MGTKVQVEADIPQTVNYVAATVAVGSTTTLEPGTEATVSNSGTEYNAVFNFGIPKGKSAYEQAIDGGYTGTEQEFNAAIGTDVQTVSDNISNVNAVASNETNINAVNANETNINIVSGDKTNIDTVATNISDINTTVSNMSAIIAAPTQASNAATSASNAQKWAEGADAQVTPLGGEHSAKGWANVAKGYADSIDLTNYRTAAAQDIIDSGKQATLVSGTNIKTVNNQSLLGSGDITISGGSLPSQTGNDGKFLTTDGTDASWGLAFSPDTLKSGKNVLVEKHINPNIITADTIALWHFDNSTIDVISNREFFPSASYVPDGDITFNYAAQPRNTSNSDCKVEISSYEPGINGNYTLDFRAAHYPWDWDYIGIGNMDYISSGCPLFLFQGNTVSWLANYSDTPHLISDINAEAWHHYAIVHKDNVTYFYVDGILKGQTNYINSTSSTFGVMIYSSANPAWMYVDELRVSKVAVWSGESFTIPTEPYAAGTDDEYYEVNATGLAKNDLSNLSSDGENHFVQLQSGVAQADVDYVVESYVNGTSWCRVYKSRWCEQGGYVQTASSIIFLKEFADTNYSVFTTFDSSVTPLVSSGCSQKATTGFYLFTRAYGVGDTFDGINWKASGFLAQGA